MRNIDFRFYTDNFSVISKAKDENGNEVMRIGGIASTEDVDSQGEILSLEGMDISRMQGSLANWQHQSLKDPSSIIGTISKAEKKMGKGLYLEVDLFSDHSKARDVYDLTKRLEKANTKQKMAFSIEGRAIERDQLDPRRVTKSIMSGVALTPTPINRATFAQILKGETDGLEEPEFQKSEAGNLIDFKDQEGNRVILDTDFNIKIEKSLTTESGAPLKKESLDKKMKVQEFDGDDNKETEENQKKVEKSFFIEDEDINFTHKLEKSQVYDLLIKSVPDISLQGVKRLYQTIEVIQKSKGDTMSELTNEKLEKALAFLSNISEQADKLEKSSHMKKDEDSESEEKESEPAKSEDKEGEMEKEFEKGKYMKKAEEEPSLDEKISKAQAELEALQAEKTKAEELKKAETTSIVEPKTILINDKPIEDLIKGFVAELGTKVDEKFTVVADLIKGLATENESVKKILSEKETALTKSESQYEKLASESKAPKSIQTKSYLVKGETEETKGTYVLNSQDPQQKQVILAKGDELINWQAVQSGDLFMKSFANELNDFQFGGPVTESMKQKFREANISVI